ncbi:glycosyltransferase family 2 protein [Salinimicrobium sp. HB62]|uniref:glycosyltransferase family 2 protein n=1 Tax=Salinimicrobium sp. HB62 TaxID=3077781 RepID=UPI002D787F3D|nr:glycosyltransferase family 2 protein [Salinimicrobium sp. HB62]
MNNEVLFSVIIPTYNRGNYLKKAILSVINQEYENWELLIIDDGSTDNTNHIVSQFKDPRIKYFYKQNEERSIARNFGIQNAQGEYICFLDSDDVFYSNHLSVLYKNIQLREFPEGMFHTQIIKNIKGENKKENWFRGLNNKEVVEKLIQGKALYMNGICISKRLFEREFFPSQFSYWEDQHLWIRLLKDHSFFSIDDITSQWNIGKDNSTFDIFKKRSLKKLDKYLGCIDHLEKDLMSKGKLMSKDKIDFLNLKLKKASVFIEIQPKYYFLNLKQFIICSKYINSKELLKLYFKLFKKGIRE